MSIDCELAIALWRKFGFLENRVSFLEDKNRRLEFTIENLIKKFEDLGKGVENLEIFQFDPYTEDLKFSIGPTDTDNNGQESIQDSDSDEKMPDLEKMPLICIPSMIEESKNPNIGRKKVKKRKNLRNKNHRLGKTKCKVCHKVLRNVSFERHQLLHSGKKPYSCTICFKRFPRKDYLTRHIFVHNNSARFQCKICWKSFQEQSKLDKHHKKVHTTPPQKDQKDEIFIMDGQVYKIPKFEEGKQAKTPEFICTSKIKEEISEIPDSDSDFCGNQIKFDKLDEKIPIIWQEACDA